MIRGIEHIGMCVSDIGSAVKSFCRAFGLPVPAVEDISERSMKVAVIRWGEVSLEFVEDYSERGPVACIVRERGDFIHHFCLVSDDIEGDMKGLEGKGIKMAQASPGPGLRGKRVAFVASGILEGIAIELSEP